MGVSSLSSLSDLEDLEDLEKKCMMGASKYWLLSLDAVGGLQYSIN